VSGHGCRSHIGHLICLLAGGVVESASTETMMLTLYHYWSSVCSQKARMCLAEKGLDWQSHHVDIFKFENYEPGT
jgi:hypothetical protein